MIWGLEFRRVLFRSGLAPALGARRAELLTATAGSSSALRARSAGARPATARKSHDADPATPRVRSNSIAGRPTQKNGVIDGSPCTPCACAGPKREPADGTGTPYTRASTTIAMTASAPAP